MEDISHTINPEAKSAKAEIDSRMPDLMKELENTIVVIDKESMRKAASEIRKGKMKI